MPTSSPISIPIIQASAHRLKFRYARCATLNFDYCIKGLNFEISGRGKVAMATTHLSLSSRQALLLAPFKTVSCADFAMMLRLIHPSLLYLILKC
jgi:hypothetical protein